MCNIEAQRQLPNGKRLAAAGSSLDTLAQPDQSGNAGVGFRKRAQAKHASHPLAWKLIELHSPLEKSYRNTLYCSNDIVQDEGILKAKYCGNRWCIVCCRIRMARAMNAYVPVLAQWDEPYFVTLTVRNCGGDELKSTIRMMLDGFTAAKRSIKRTHHLPFKAVRKLECTYNKGRRDYHPHFHIIVEGREQAELLRMKWLEEFPDMAEAIGQDVRPCADGAITELFKYFTKLTTKVGSKKEWMPPEALDVIFRAMKGRRVWQAVGFKLPKEVVEEIEGEEIEVKGTPAFKRPDDPIVWVWVQIVADWVDMYTGERLSDNVPTAEWIEFVASMASDPDCLELVGGDNSS